jgi:hypothetical protein
MKVVKKILGPIVAHVDPHSATQARLKLTLKRLFQRSDQKNAAFGEMVKQILEKNSKIPKQKVLMTNYEGGFKGSARADPIIKAILAFEKKHYTSEQLAALSSALHDWKDRNSAVKYCLSRSEDGHMIVSVSVRDDDNFFFKENNAILGDILHRGLAYFIGPDGNVICRLNGVPKFFEPQKDKGAPEAEPVSWSASEKKNGEFCGITFKDGWLIIQSKTSSSAYFIGSGDQLTLVNVLLALYKKYKSSKDDVVPQTLQVAIITVVKLLRMAESERKAYITAQNGVTKIGELCTGRHFVVYRGEPTVVVFAEWRDGEQVFVQDLPDDPLFEHPECLAPTADKAAVDAFCNRFQFNEGVVLVAHYADGTVRRFKIKAGFYNEVLKGMPTKPTGLRHQLWMAFRKGEVLSSEPTPLSAELQSIVAAYGVEINDPNWCSTVWKALRVCSMIALINPDFVDMMKFLISGNKGWGAVGFREVVEAFRVIDPADLDTIASELQEPLAEYFKAKEQDEQLKKALLAWLLVLKQAMAAAVGKEKGPIAAKIGALLAFKKSGEDVATYVKNLTDRFSSAEGRKAKKAQTALDTFMRLRDEVQASLQGGGAAAAPGGGAK